MARSWRARVAVAGHSMEPILRDGDWLLVDPLAYARLAPQPGDLVVTKGQPWLVKRVAAVESDALTLAGDHPAHAEDGVRVRRQALIGRPWFRYWPLRRIGRLR